MLSDSNPLRKLIVRAVVHPAFDRFILAVILLNAAVMGMADYTRVGTDPRRDDYGYGEAGSAPETGDWVYAGIQPNGKPMKFNRASATIAMSPGKRRT